MSRKYNPRKYNPKWEYAMKTKEEEFLKASEALRSTASKESSWKWGRTYDTSSKSTSGSSISSAIALKGVLDRRSKEKRKNELTFELDSKKNPTIIDILNHPINNKEPVVMETIIPPSNGERIEDKDYEEVVSTTKEEEIGMSDIGF